MSSQGAFLKNNFDSVLYNFNWSYLFLWVLRLPPSGNTIVSETPPLQLHTNQQLETSRGSSVFFFFPELVRF